MLERIQKSVYYRIDYCINRLKYILNIGKIRNDNPYVMNSIQTIETIYNTRCSISRFGDGEFYLMLELDFSPFQKCTPELTKDLLEIIANKQNGILIGLPDTFDSVNKYEKNSRKFWQAFMGKYRNQIVGCLPSDYRNRIYANTNSTRFYSGLTDKTACLPIIKAFKKIWKGRSVICIEGEKTRLGVGNDLFDNTAEFQRILLPAKNAYSKVYEVLDWIEENKEQLIKRDTLFILAVGMAATVLAYRLYEHGYQALDLGHIDIQYEYYLHGAKTKIAIPGKYTNENVNGKNPDDDILDDKYINSIIKKFVE